MAFSLFTQPSCVEGVCGSVEDASLTELVTCASICCATILAMHKFVFTPLFGSITPQIAIDEEDAPVSMELILKNKRGKWEQTRAPASAPVPPAKGAKGGARGLWMSDCKAAFKEWTAEVEESNKPTGPLRLRSQSQRAAR